MQFKDTKLDSIKLFDRLVERNFSLIYVKRGSGPKGEGAEFRLHGSLKTGLDRKKAAAFVGKAVKDRSLQESVIFIDSKGACGVELISSAMLDDELDDLGNYTFEGGAVSF